MRLAARDLIEPHCGMRLLAPGRVDHRALLDAMVKSVSAHLRQPIESRQPIGSGRLDLWRSYLVMGRSARIVEGRKDVGDPVLAWLTPARQRP